MINNDVQFKWTYVEKEGFEKIKVTIVVATTLESHISLNTFYCKKDNHVSYIQSKNCFYNYIKIY
jgi:hypothetical protein